MFHLKMIIYKFAPCTPPFWNLKELLGKLNTTDHNTKYMIHKNSHCTTNHISIFNKLKVILVL